jgi:2-iminobutanoate/2-iminopropanoate deaminase
LTESHRDIVATDRAPKAIGPYSQAVRTGHLVFTAGQLGIDPATGVLVDGGVAAQTAQALRNVSAVLEEAGSSLERVVKTTVFLLDMADFAEMNTVYASFFSAAPPARSTVAVRGLPAGGRVEVEAVGVAGD